MKKNYISIDLLKILLEESRWLDVYVNWITRSDKLNEEYNHLNNSEERKLFEIKIGELVRAVMDHIINKIELRSIYQELPVLDDEDEVGVDVNSKIRLIN